MGTAPSLDGRTFAGVSNDPAGDVGSETRFQYHEESDGVVWARYEGGTVRLGHLVGRRDGDGLDFRYSHVTTSGTTANGHCRSRIVVPAAGPLELHEEWEWESQPGSGTSLVREIAAVASAGPAQQRR